MAATLIGPAVTYGDIATGPKGPERFEPRAFVSGLPTAALNLQHDQERVLAEQPGGLTLTDSSREPSLTGRIAFRQCRGPDWSVGARWGASPWASSPFGNTRTPVRASDYRKLTSTTSGPGGPPRVSHPRPSSYANWIAAALVAVIPINRPLQCECIGEECGAIQFGAERLR